MPPGTFEFAPANLAHALRVAPVQQGSMFEDMCGRGMLNMSHSEIRFVQEQCGDSDILLFFYSWDHFATTCRLSRLSV